MEYETLIAKIATPDDRILVAEATSCVKFGAYRAAYILTWLAIAESIKIRIKELGVRDKKMRDKYSTLLSRESLKKSIDLELIQLAKSYGLVTPEYLPRIEYIFEMRCVFAHPYRVAPTKAEVDAALVVAVDALLAHPPLLGAEYARQLEQNIFDSRIYLADDEAKVVDFARKIVAKISPLIRRDLIVSIIGKLEVIFDDPDMQFFKRRALWFIKGALENIGAELREDAWGLDEVILSHPKSTSNVLIAPDFWALLSERSQDMLLSILLPDQGVIDAVVIDQVLLLSNENLLGTEHNEKFHDVVTQLDLAVVVKTMVPFDSYGDKIVDELRSRDWYQQNPAIELLQVAGPERLSTASPDLQNRLGRNLYQAADGESRDAKTFLGSLETSETKWPLEFVKGVVAEPFIDDDGKFRLKPKYARSALLAAKSYGDEGEELINSLCGCIEEGIPKNFMLSERDFERTTAAVNRIKDADGVGPAFSQALGAIEQKELCKSLEYCILGG